MIRARGLWLSRRSIEGMTGDIEVHECTTIWLKAYMSQGPDAWLNSWINCIPFIPSCHMQSQSDDGAHSHAELPQQLHGPHSAGLPGSHAAADSAHE